MGIFTAALGLDRDRLRRGKQHHLHHSRQKHLKTESAPRSGNIRASRGKNVLGDCEHGRKKQKRRNYVGYKARRYNVTITCNEIIKQAYFHRQRTKMSISFYIRLGDLD